ncbi:uncharacterized protein LOC133187938 [Saccostrea echinata]|uniref:uncharacterized protein LOC133187938 n=1 Tax=Saccostrea echinata TaxID=191078 RepID=UPI002A82EA87|nr:uncharacterized protein LOC133187938 [Saccostrea echinata]
MSYRNYRTEFPKEERNDAQNTRSDSFSFKRLTRSHYRSKPYEYNKPRENRHSHIYKQHRYQTSRESHVDRNSSECTSRSDRLDQVLEENYDDRKRYTTHLNERSYRKNQTSRDNQDRYRSASQGYVNTRHHREKSSRKDNQDKKRSTRQRNEDESNRYKWDQALREDNKDMNRSTRQRYEDVSNSYHWGQTIREDNQSKNRSTRQRYEDVPNSYNWDQTLREDHQDRKRSSARMYESRRKDEEKDDLAAKIFKVLLYKGGKMKKRELEACVLAESFAKKFMPNKSFSRFLKDYKNIFEISDACNDEKEEGEITDPEVRARSNIQICLDHTSSSYVCNGDCNDLHICKFKLISECPFENCRFGHDLQTDHNRHSLKHHFMQFLNPEQVRFLISELEHRKGVTIPSICNYYNKIKGCKESIKCPHLHVCSYIAGKCAFQPNCKRSHNLEDDQPRRVLSKFGIAVDANNKERLLRMLSWDPFHFPRGQGQVSRKIPHPIRQNGSIKPVKACPEETENTQEGTLLEPYSEFHKRHRYWNLVCMVRILDYAT